MISKLDQVILVSPEQAAFFEPILGSDRIRVILHGIDTQYFTPGDRSNGKKRFRCITVGHYLRDFRAVREVAVRLADHRDIEFHVVTSRETGLEGLANVTIHKNVDDDMLLKLYQESDVLFLPLLSSTANNALLEGIACGLPVVSSFLPSIRAYLPGREAILIKDNDPEELAESILYLLRNPAEVARMAGDARRRAEELSWQNITPQYEAAYASVINQ